MSHAVASCAHTHTHSWRSVEFTLKEVAQVHGNSLSDEIVDAPLSCKQMVFALF